MCDKINKEFWKCLEKNKYLDISKCAKLQKKELECLFKEQKVARGLFLFLGINV